MDERENKFKNRWVKDWKNESMGILMEVRIGVGRCSDELMDERANCGQVPLKCLLLAL